MSSFTAAALLLEGIDPAAIAITLDPANMIVEGREDWEFGMQLSSSYIANVHLKNATQTAAAGTARWHWEPTFDGMVDWRQMLGYLHDIDYGGPYAIEDFLTPCITMAGAVRHLRETRLQFMGLASRPSSDCELRAAAMTADAMLI